MTKRMLTIALACALVFCMATVDVHSGSTTLATRGGALDFMNGASCGGAAGTLIVLGAALAGSVTLGVGAVIGLGIGGMIAGAGCSLY